MSEPWKRHCRRCGHDWSETIKFEGCPQCGGYLWAKTRTIPSIANMAQASGMRFGQFIVNAAEASTTADEMTNDTGEGTSHKLFYISDEDLYHACAEFMKRLKGQKE